MNNKNISTILFDLDGTLRFSTPNGNEVMAIYAASLGAPSGEEARRKALRWTYEYWADSKTLACDTEAFGRGNDEFWTNYSYRVLIALGCDEDLAQKILPQVAQYMDTSYESGDLVPPETYTTLEYLKDAGFKLGLVTNRSNPVDEYLAEIDLARFFDFYFHAGQIDIWKPEPGIFEHALKLAEAAAEESIYVGDNLFADIYGAQNVNIQPVLIDPHQIFPEVDVPTIRKIEELIELVPARKYA